MIIETFLFLRVKITSKGIYPSDTENLIDSLSIGVFIRLKQNALRQTIIRRRRGA